jgi:hypothetical protein
MCFHAACAPLVDKCGKRLLSLAQVVTELRRQLPDSGDATQPVQRVPASHPSQVHQRVSCAILEASKAYPVAPAARARRRCCTAIKSLVRASSQVGCMLRTDCRFAAMNPLRFAVGAGAILASSLSVLAESSSGGETNAGGQFMSSYMHSRPATASVRRPVGAPRRDPNRAPSSLLEAIASGAVSPSEAAALQSVLDNQY